MRFGAAGGLLALLHKVAEAIGAWGYLGAFLGMALESACIPIPSEVTLPLAGFLAWRGKVNPVLAALAALSGCMVGATVAYMVGRHGGRPFVKRFGRYILLTEHRLEAAERWFERWGAWTVLFGRWVTGIRAIVSIPAGLFGVPYPKFIAFTLVGYGAWCAAGVWLGYALGENWTAVVEFFERLDIWVLALVGLAVLALLGFLGIKKFKLLFGAKEEKRPEEDKAD